MTIEQYMQTLKDKYTGDPRAQAVIEHDTENNLSRILIIREGVRWYPSEYMLHERGASFEDTKHVFGLSPMEAETLDDAEIGEFSQTGWSEETEELHNKIRKLLLDTLNPLPIEEVVES